MERGWLPWIGEGLWEQSRGVRGRHLAHMSGYCFAFQHFISECVDSSSSSTSDSSFLLMQEIAGDGWIPRFPGIQRLKLNSRLLLSAWPCTSCRIHFGNKPADRRSLFEIKWKWISNDVQMFQSMVVSEGGQWITNSALIIANGSTGHAAWVAVGHSSK